jgi:hypothetical protein
LPDKLTEREHDGGKMKIKDSSRKWLWLFLGGVVALQSYFVQELVAAFALFALGFVALAFVVGTVYAMHRAWALLVERTADSQHPAMTVARERLGSVEDLVRRPFRRPGSEPAR